MPKIMVFLPLFSPVVAVGLTFHTIHPLQTTPLRDYLPTHARTTNPKNKSHKSNPITPQQLHANPEAQFTLTYFTLANPYIYFALDVPRHISYNILVRQTWGLSAAGSAFDWQSRGQGFDPPSLHQKTPQGVFFYPKRDRTRKGRPR